MMHRTIVALLSLSWMTLSCPYAAHADGDLGKVNHLVFMMQENRSFDNYFGVLPYVQGGPYHPCGNRRKLTDHRCVDGLTCQVGTGGELACSNYNVNMAGEKIFAFHNRRICGASGLDHGWPESHRRLPA